MGIKRVTRSILVMRVERSLLKSASGAGMFVNILDRMSMKLQSTSRWLHGGHSAAAWRPSIGGIKLILGPCVFTAFDLQKMVVPLSWKDLARSQKEVLWKEPAPHGLFLGAFVINLLATFYQRGLFEHMSKYAPNLHFKCARPQPLHLIWITLALKRSWRHKLPEHMLRFV
eukprot:1156061-Pelagomonas_calceolata.AAC.13